VSRRYVLYLEDMLEACAKIQEFASGLHYNEFVTYGMPYYSIIRLLEIIGEAAKNIPEHVRGRYPEVKWRQIIRARDLLAHHYFGLEDETLWEIVQEHIPELREQLGPIIAAEENRDS
jgi:uncharacterized protein with HEPN domain